MLFVPLLRVRSFFIILTKLYSYLFVYFIAERILFKLERNELLVR